MSTTETTNGQSETETTESADFLTEQAEMTKAALGRVLRDAQVALAEGVDPKEWARRYPLATLGAALVVGFAGVALAVPSKQKQELRKLERIRRALAPDVASETDDGKHHAAAPAKPSIWHGILKEIIGAIRPILSGLISAKMATHQDHDAAGPVPPQH